MLVKFGGLLLCLTPRAERSMLLLCASLTLRWVLLLCAPFYHSCILVFGVSPNFLVFQMLLVLGNDFHFPISTIK